MRTVFFVALFIFLCVVDVVDSIRRRRAAGRYWEPGDGIGWKDEYP